MKKSLSILILILYPILLLAQPLKVERKPDLLLLRQKIQTKLDELHTGSDYPGVTVGLALADGTSISVSSGFSDLENRVPMLPSDRMLSGSIGKTYVSAVMLQLVQEGKVKLDEKIERWFGHEKWFGRLPNWSEITVRMLMNHTSGIQEHVLNKQLIDELRKNPDKVWPPEELISYILDSKPLFPAGQGWSYADTNYILVGMIIERVTKNTFYDELTRRILKPLKLEQTVPANSRSIPGLITGYSRKGSPFGFEGRVITDGRFIINPQFEWTGGGLATNADDLARWAKALYEGRVVKKPYLEQMLVAVEAKTGKGDKYGLGVQVRQSEWGLTYGHGGWFPGYLSEMEYFPRHKTAIAVQFNTDAFNKLNRSLRVYIAEMGKIVFGG
jgi:D-alanyl-D-alanine carboxypeptidase